ncbi:flagella basal body P-ring formation protein FlgA [Novosphingobium sp. B 225]|uniref:flagella basal body P-ring formation protein FlgA n=1 Tax=Novosphingobium sp. B 225 TaxID=1961849 RepID=UPI000B4BD6E7|nr:flagella basal body P-ring formation protein FlgA [Novosphingobium sp. B 225]
MLRRLALTLSLIAAPATAKPGQADLAAIDQAVANFTGLPLGSPGGAAAPVDRRLRLGSCGVPLALSWYGSRNDSVQVDCPVAGGWRLYVPIASRGAATPAPAAIAKGDAISISVSGDGFAVAQPGEALESGPVGAWIKVRTLGSNAQPMRARVLRPGQTGIDLP